MQPTMKKPRICRKHDPDDVITGRICGHHLPCPHHPPRRKAVRDWSTTPNGLRHRVEVALTLPRDVLSVLAILAHRYQCSRSQVVERLIRSAERLPA
jgi:hypothetical protein